MEPLLEKIRSTALTRPEIESLAQALEGPLEPLVKALLDRGESVEALVMAAAQAGHRLDVSLVMPGLTFLEEPQSIFNILGCTDGNHLEALLDAVDGGTLSHEREALCLLICTELLDGPSPARRLVQLLRQLSRKPLTTETGMLVGIAARRLDDEHLNQVAARWLALAAPAQAERIAQRLLEPLHHSVLDRLPQRVMRVTSGFTMRRSTKKVGRNDPCHCGSGKKYKKCCLHEDEASPTSMTPSNDPALLESHDLADLPIRELCKLDYTRIEDDRQLLLVWHRLQDHRLWEAAEQALEEFLERPTSDPGHRLDFVDQLLRAGEYERARIQMEKCDEVLPDQLFELELVGADSPILDKLERLLVEHLARDYMPDLVDLTYVILKKYPALGILLARGLIMGRDLDSIGLVDQIEMARDRLNLPPGDLAEDILDAQLDRGLETVQSDDSRSEEQSRATEQLQAELAQAKQVAQKLRAELASKQKQLERELARQPEVVTRVLDDPEATRLRERVRELKGLLHEGNAERKRLREQARAVASSQPTPKPAVARAVEDSLEEDAPAISWPPLLPLFSPRGMKAFQSCDEELRRKALMRLGELCAGSASVLSQMKSLKVRPDLRSLRIGRNHRLLVRPVLEQGQLEVVDFIPRRDLERSLR